MHILQTPTASAPIIPSLKTVTKTTLAASPFSRSYFFFHVASLLFKSVFTVELAAVSCSCCFTVREELLVSLCGGCVKVPAAALELGYVCKVNTRALGQWAV